MASWSLWSSGIKWKMYLESALFIEEGQQILGPSEKLTTHIFGNCLSKTVWLF